MEVTTGLHAFIWRDFQVNNCNSYLIRGSKNILIDPGLFQAFGNIKGELRSLDLRPDQIDLVMITHGHYDHMDAAGELDRGIPVVMSLREYEFLKDSGGAARRIQPDFFLKEGDLTVGDVHLQIVSAPGHSPGSVCIYWPKRKALFSGDVVFDHGIGRTDLPGGDGGLLKKSIQTLTALDIEYLLPGHGEPVTGKQNVQSNFEEIERTWFSYL